MTHALFVSLMLLAPAAAKKPAAKQATTKKNSPPAAEAEDPSVVKARQLFADAQQLYKQARYAEAIARFEEAYVLRPHPVIYFNIGRCHEQLADIPKALRAYRDYLRLLPDAQDKVEVSAAITNLEARLRERGQQQLLVVAEPADARIIVDGKDLGTSPASIELVAGNHTVKVTADGYDTYESAFVMQLNRSVDKTVVLRVATGAPPLVPAEEPKLADAPVRDEPKLTPADVPEAGPAVAVSSSGGEKKGRVWTWVVGGAAVASAGAGVGLGVGSMMKSAELQQAPVRSQAGNQELHNAARDLAIGANVAYGVAAVAAVTAIVLFFVE